MNYKNAQNLLSNYSSLKDAKDKYNAGVIVDFVSNLNIDLFMQILKESDRMTEEMKELIAPELIELRLIIASNKKELANKDAEIAKLKQQLQEISRQQK